jgi:hypothetical protein
METSNLLQVALFFGPPETLTIVTLFRDWEIPHWLQKVVRSESAGIASPMIAMVCPLPVKFCGVL